MQRARACELEEQQIKCLHWASAQTETGHYDKLHNHSQQTEAMEDRNKEQIHTWAHNLSGTSQQQERINGAM